MVPPVAHQHQINKKQIKIHQTQGRRCLKHIFWNAFKNMSETFGLQWCTVWEIIQKLRKLGAIVSLLRSGQPSSKSATVPHPGSLKRYKENIQASTGLSHLSKSQCSCFHYPTDTGQNDRVVNWTPLQSQKKMKACLICFGRIFWGEVLRRQEPLLHTPYTTDYTEFYTNKKRIILTDIHRGRSNCFRARATLHNWGKHEFGSLAENPQG